MKRKRFFRSLFAMMTSVLMVLCVGCASSFGELDGDDDTYQEDVIETQSLDGVKVLSRPSDYSLEDALGEYSTNFYNLFAAELLTNLYQVYENPTNLLGDLQQIFYSTESDYGADLTDDSDIYTYSDYYSASLLSGDTSSVYYLFDSLRYTISSINTISSTSSDIITLDYSTAWNWTVADDAAGNFGSFYYNIKNSSYSGRITEIGTKSSKKVGTVQLAEDITFSGLYESLDLTTLLPNLSSFYSGTAVQLENGTNDYYTSPYSEYNTDSSGQTVFSDDVKTAVSSGTAATTGATTAINYFQDALEYVTYLFVLGYEYDSAEDADFFDIEIVRNLSTGLVSDILVGGWGSGKISISNGEDCALELVKNRYISMGNYIGLTDTNRQQLADFVLSEIIGADALAADTFTVNFYTDGGAQTSLTFCRNYEAIVERVINYACEQVTIGVDTTTGEQVTMKENYLISQITDYSGDYATYFFVTYEDETSDSDGSDNWLKNIAPAEYQSFVIFPQNSDIKNGYPLTDIALVLEYYDDPNDAFSDTSGKTYADSITINIGARFYDYSAGQVIEFTAGQVTIKYGKYSEISDDPDDYIFLLSTEENMGVVTLDQDIIFDKTKTSDNQYRGYFNNDIGGGVLNASENGTDATSGFGSNITLTGSSAAKDYYKSNDSSSYGVYGSLDESMFAGEDGCDFFEIYFDIVKEKGADDVNYNFKVGLWYVFYDEPVSGTDEDVEDEALALNEAKVLEFLPNENKQKFCA